MSELTHKRILVKFSGESVAGTDEHGIDPKILDNMASSIKSCKKIGAQIGIVIGGGNLFRGEKLNKAGMDRVAGDHMGMLATVMNGIALRDALERAGIKTRVMSAISMSGIVEHYDRRLAIQLLSDGFVVIFTAGTGNPFFTTDTAGCLRAIETQSDLMLKATRVDGVYDSDPEINKEAKFFDSLSFDDAISKNLKVMDATALTLARDHGLPINVFNVGRHNALDKMIGNAINKSQINPQKQFITCSGRLNFELVQKLLMTNISLMIGVGAPTSLAIDLANRFDMTLIGFVKEDSFNIYTNNQKVIVN